MSASVCCAAAGAAMRRADLARALLALVGYADRTQDWPRPLPHVDRRLVEIARALATSPAVLLLDEPAAGLNEADTARLGDLLQRLATRRPRRRARRARHVARDVDFRRDRGARRRTPYRGRDARVVRNDPAVKAAYLGTTMSAGSAVARTAGASSARSRRAERRLWRARACLTMSASRSGAAR